MALNAALDDVLGRGLVKTLPGYGGLPPVRGEVLTRKRKRFEHPLNYMLARDAISYGLWYGGLRFHADYELACISGDGTVNWDRLTSFRGRGGKVHKGAAHRRYGGPTPVNKQPIDSATTLARLRNQLGEVGFKIVAAVCGHGINLAELSNATNTNKRTISEHFHEALEMVADHYSMTIDARERT